MFPLSFHFILLNLVLIVFSLIPPIFPLFTPSCHSLEFQSISSTVIYYLFISLLLFVMGSFKQTWLQTGVQVPSFLQVMIYITTPQPKIDFKKHSLLYRIATFGLVDDKVTNSCKLLTFKNMLKDVLFSLVYKFAHLLYTSIFST